MRDELLKYYQAELSFMRRMAVGFKEQYPKIASRLLIEDGDFAHPNARGHALLAEGLAAQGVPGLWKYVKDGEKRRVLELILGQQVFGRPFMLPPGVPAERAAILRKAFEATMADKAFVADAEKMGLEITPASGARVQDVVAKMYASPPAIVKRAREALRPSD